MTLSKIKTNWSDWSVNTTYDSDGFAVTTWSTCGRCGGKISPRNRNEVTQGLHKRCMTQEIQQSGQPLCLSIARGGHQLTLTLFERED